MKDTEFVREAMYIKRVKASNIAERCGYKNQSNVNSVLTAKEGMRTTTFVKLLDALGLTLNVVDKETGAIFATVGENGFEVVGEPFPQYKQPYKAKAEAPSDLPQTNLEDMTVEELQSRMKLLGEAVKNENIPKENRGAYAKEYVDVFALVKRKTALAEAQEKLN